MERQRTETAQLSAPPLHPTELTPNEIVGYENMPIFIQHLRICKSGTNAGEFPAARLNREIGPANRDKMASILAELRGNGFYPLGVNERGRVVWGIVLKSQSQRLFERDLGKYQKMPVGQLQAMGRGGFRQLRDNEDMPDAEEFQIDYERLR